MGSTKYNFIYKDLVKADDDILGLIAYGIYKKHKIEFITKIKKEERREPTEEECRSFYAASTTTTQLDAYRSQAETMLSETVGSIAQEEIKNFERDMLKDYKKEISSCIPSNWKSFGTSIVAGIISTLLFTVIAGTFYFIGETSDRNTKESIETLINNKIKTPADSVTVQQEH